MHNQTCILTLAVLRGLCPSSIYPHLMNTGDTASRTQNLIVFNRMSYNFKQCKTELSQSQSSECENCISIKPLYLTKVSIYLKKP